MEGKKKGYSFLSLTLQTDVLPILVQGTPAKEVKSFFSRDVEQQVADSKVKRRTTCLAVKGSAYQKAVVRKGMTRNLEAIQQDLEDGG